jgi:hypothetical protein
MIKKKLFFLHFLYSKNKHANLSIGVSLALAKDPLTISLFCRRTILTCTREAHLGPLELHYQMPMYPFRRFTVKSGGFSLSMFENGADNVNFILKCYLAKK